MATIKVWGFGTRKPKQAAKKKAGKAAKKRAMRRVGLQVEQPAEVRVTKGGKK